MKITHIKGFVMVLFTCIVNGIFGQSSTNGLPFLTPSVQKAHYPLNIFLHNTYAVNDNFIELRPWDVSGNGKHGTFKNVNPSMTSDPKNYKEARVPFYSLFKKPLEGKRYTVPDNTFVNFIMNEERGVATEVKTGEINLETGSFRTLTGKPQAASGYIEIPHPFTEASQSWTVSFWCKLSDPNSHKKIISTKYFDVIRNGKQIVLSGLRYEISCVLPMEGTEWLFTAISFDVQTNKIFFRTFSDGAPFQVEDKLPNPFNAEKNPTSAILPGSSNDRGDVEIFSVRFLQTSLAIEQVMELFTVEKENIKQVPDSYSINHQSIVGANAIALSNNDVNRFGKPNAALKLGPGEHQVTQSFFPANYDTKQGYSISFWTNITELLTSGEFPFDNRATERFQFVYGKNGIDILFGIQRVKDILGINRYYDNKKTHLRNPVFAWLWDPVSFNMRYRTGWYHVIVVYDPAMVHVYMYHPFTNELFTQIDYFSAQNLGEVEEWGVGNPAISSPKIKYPIYAAPSIDDIKTYTWPLDVFEVEALHALETRLPTKEGVSKAR